MSGPSELYGWDDIASFLGFTRRTAQKCERERGLPIKRAEGRRGRVSALLIELEAWRTEQSEQRTKRKAELESGRPTINPNPVCSGSSRLTGTGVAKVSALDVLDILPFGVVILSAKAKVRHSNRRAKELLTGSELSIEGAVFHARSLAHTKAITDALEDLANGHTDGAIGFTIARASHRPASVLLFTLGASPATNKASLHRQIVAIICDPEHHVRISSPLLRKLFDFTPTEALVATLMLGGKNTRTIAQELRITDETVRGHLKAMFIKTNCRNQGELLHLLLCSPASLSLVNDATSGLISNEG